MCVRGGGVVRLSCAQACSRAVLCCSGSGDEAVSCSLPSAAKHSLCFHVLEGPRAESTETCPQVFVYGSLLPGLHNNGVLERAKLLGHHQTRPSYDMFSLGYYPAVCGGGATAISGALYQVSRDTLAKLDRLEGHPQWYQRELVDLSPKGALEPLWAWMYLMSRSEGEICGGWAEHVPSGDWLAFHTKASHVPLASKRAASQG